MKRLYVRPVRGTGLGRRPPPLIGEALAIGYAGCA
jgi:hypothetical protein